jgi:pimeloyl-ACP methyl ester carboxylesterase
MKKGYVDISAGQMHYRFCGKGKPLIMLHMSGASSEEFDAVGDLIADKFTVYAPDFINHGSSDKFPNGVRYTMQEHAETVIEFMDALKIDKAIIYGTLAGANIGARIAYKWPERVEGLMFAEFVYFPDYEEYRKMRANFTDVNLDDEGNYMTTIWKRVAQFGYPAKFNHWRVIAELQAIPFSECLHQSMFEDDDYNKILPKINAPTVVVGFEKYPLAPRMKLVAQIMPNAKDDMYKESQLYEEVAQPKMVADMILKYYG